MATIYNNQTLREIQRAGGIQQNIDAIPMKLGDTVIPVIECNPKLLQPVKIVRSNVATNATVATVYTTPTDQDFYLTSLSMSVIKDVTSTAIISYTSVIIDGMSNRLMRIYGLQLTPQSSNMAVSFVPPIKLDRGSVIVVGNDTLVANISAAASITGFVVETDTT
jgi:hypothetical protein